MGQTEKVGVPSKLCIWHFIVDCDMIFTAVYTIFRCGPQVTRQTKQVLTQHQYHQQQQHSPQQQQLQQQQQRQQQPQHHNLTIEENPYEMIEP